MTTHRRFRFPALLLAMLVTAAAPAQSTAGAGAAPWQPAPGFTTLPLWTGTAPGTMEAKPGLEIDPAIAAPGRPASNVSPVAGRRIQAISNVTVPTLTVYPAGPASTSGKSGTAVLVFPGGGYRLLAIDLEGTEVCDWLSHAGVTCVLVKYRVPETGPYPKSTAALNDAQRAISLVRQHASEWGIDPHRVGVLGFSAGAHLAAALSTHFAQRLYPPADAADTEPLRPDFQVILYPGYLADADHGFTTNPDIAPTSETPPAFILQAENDPVHVENAVNYFGQLKRAGVPAELHIYPAGGHGFGLRANPAAPVAAAWPHLAEQWMESLGMMPASTGAGAVAAPRHIP